MTDLNPVSITGTITITVLPQDNGHYICQMSPDLGDFSKENLQCYGQTKEHAIAIAKRAASLGVSPDGPRTTKYRLGHSGTIRLAQSQLPSITMSLWENKD